MFSKKKDTWFIANFQGKKIENPNMENPYKPHSVLRIPTTELVKSTLQENSRAAFAQDMLCYMLYNNYARFFNKHLVQQHSPVLHVRTSLERNSTAASHDQATDRTTPHHTTTARAQQMTYAAGYSSAVCYLPPITPTRAQLPLQPSERGWARQAVGPWPFQLASTLRSERGRPIRKAA